MTKIKIKCISPHQPQGIVEVEQEKVKSLLETKQYVLIEEVRNKAELKKDLSVTKNKKGIKEQDGNSD